MTDITPIPVKPPLHDGVTPFPKDLLKELISTLKYDPESSRSGPDSKSDHTTVEGLERTAFMVLGDNIFDWEQKLAAKESGYNNPELGRKLYRYCRPLLPKNMRWLHSDAIMDALAVYEQDSQLSFAAYGPYDAGFLFSESLLKVGVKKKSR